MRAHPFVALLVFITSIIFSISAQAFVLSGFKWDTTDPGVGATLSWGYAADGSNCRVGSDPCGGGTVSSIASSILPEGAGTIDSEVRRAFSALSSVADLTFTFSNNNPDILLGGHFIDGPGGGPGTTNTLAHAFSSFFLTPGANGNPNLFHVGSVSDVHFDTANNFRLARDNTAGSSYFFNTLLHELGHSLGLGHTGVPNSLMNELISEDFDGLQADDIAGLQFLYGPSPTFVPIPAAFWLLLSGFGFLISMRKRFA
ncbi:MAG: matrixin family metalloprotease [Gammaproteobacteria bacterium]|nr:matrixin family metalloprotease [Gammaproteobacteria bacterium]